MKITAIVTAGGSSVRFGSDKLLEKIDNKEILRISAEKFLCDEIAEIIVTASKNNIEKYKNLLKDIKKVKVTEGGNSRQKSVYNAIKTIDNSDFVIIHDAARPFVKKEDIINCLNKAIETKAAILAVKTTDTIKEVDENNKIIRTFNRSVLRNVQTPQIFDFQLIKSAHEKLKDKDFTDDASMLEFLGYDVYVVEGDYSNIKITNKNDLPVF